MIKEEIKDIISRTVHIDRNTIGNGNTFKDLRLDSIDVVQVVAVIEDTYDIELDENEVDEIKTFSDFVKYVEQKIEEKVECKDKQKGGVEC